MKSNFLIILGVSLFGYVLNHVFKTKEFVNKLQIELQSISIDVAQTKQSNFKYLFYTVNLVLINPVNFSIFIESILCNIYFFDAKIGNAISTKKIKIESKKIAIIPIKLKLDLETLPFNLTQSIINSIEKKELVLNVTGKINFKNSILNFSLSKKVI